MERQDRQDRETERHRTTLMRLLAFIFVYAGLADDTGSAASDTGRAGRAFEASREAWTLSRRACRRLLLLLRPVEAATRRLIVVLASGLPILNPRAAGSEHPATQPAPTRSPSPLWGGVRGGGSSIAAPSGDGKTSDARPPLFALADRPKRYEWFFSGKPHGAGWKGPSPALPGDDELDAAGILRRIAALARALDDLPAQADRLVRWRLRRMAARAAGKARALSPLRPGIPPGSLPRRAPKRERREEHDLLSETHALARDALVRFDTS
ncbi:hypothetical protein [Mesorhizobium sp. ZC-5]|uniref:hypothetical protein n=1 Tax=Mesorhizobium sp. ZC-5 TaxID=2986066 RepID=UPI0021E90AE7|nr:hypothetical protein [Mesorhizobium sp. ZC-5]MCV3239309.1 hypothetical protein [Mesorhizobium sp. ZC-5]